MAQNDPARANEPSAPAQARGTAQRQQGAPEAEDHDLTFGDILDILNPLQHIPIISQIYRAITGDKISGFAQVAGGALFGGPLGLVGGVIEAATEDVTGKGAGETFVASLFGEKQKETQIASSDRPPDEDKTLETQVATATPPAADEEELPKMATSSPPSGNDRLDTQIAQGMLPPVAPRTQIAEAEKPKAPYGGVMDMTAVNANKSAPSALAAAEPVRVENEEAPREEIQTVGTDKAVPLSILPHAPAMMDGRKVYSLAGVRRVSNGNPPAMPAYSGPDVRLKPVTRQSSTTGRITAPAPTMAPINSPEAEAARILGLARPAAPVAALDGAPALTPADADLLPSQGASDPLPTALIEDMMKMGLDKYQKGLNSGTLQAAPSVDVRG